MEARSPTLPRTGTISVSPDTRRETTDFERTRIRASSASDRRSKLLFGFCNIVISMELQQHRKNACRLRQNFSDGSIKHSKRVLRWLTSLSVQLDRRRSHGPPLLRS